MGGKRGVWCIKQQVAQVPWMKPKSKQEEGLLVPGQCLRWKPTAQSRHSPLAELGIHLCQGEGQGSVSMESELPSPWRTRRTRVGLRSLPGQQRTAAFQKGISASSLSPSLPPKKLIFSFRKFSYFSAQNCPIAPIHVPVLHVHPTQTPCLFSLSETLLQMPEIIQQ